MSIGIYKITNLKTNKIYIGQSVDIERRFRQHCSRNEQQIDKSIQKYGVDNFTFEIIELCSPEDLNKREDYWIRYYNSLIPNGYNMNYYKGTYGEYNANSKLTTEEVIEMRKIYSSHEYVDFISIWQKYSEKINYNNFRSVFAGRLWSNVMPEVFTQDNYLYYQKIINKHSRANNQNGEKNTQHIVSEDDVMAMREMYVDHRRQDIFDAFPQYTERTIVSIISGQNWKHLPIYKKRNKIWIFPKESEES